MSHRRGRQAGARLAPRRLAAGFAALRPAATATEEDWGVRHPLHRANGTAEQRPVLRRALHRTQEVTDLPSAAPSLSPLRANEDAPERSHRGSHPPSGHRAAASIAAMTVAALLLPASAEEALTRIDGRPLVRRLVDAAWAGGAVPVIVSVADPAGDVAAALAGAPATLVPPADVLGGVDAAVREVSETDAVMVWPTAYAWVDPETLTSLIEAHGVTPQAVLRPSYDGGAGWPVLVPVGVATGARERTQRPGRLEEALAAIDAPVRLLDLGIRGASTTCAPHGPTCRRMQVRPGLPARITSGAAWRPKNRTCTAGRSRGPRVRPGWRTGLARGRCPRRRRGLREALLRPGPRPAPSP